MAALAVAPLAAHAAPGDFDPAFGQAGIATLPHVDSRAAFATSDGAGRVLAIGTGAHRELIARMLANGSLDTTFNGTGVVHPVLPPLLPTGPLPPRGHRGLALLPGSGNGWVAYRAEDWFCPTPAGCDMGYQPRLLGRRVNADGSAAADFSAALGGGEAVNTQIVEVPGNGAIAVSATRNNFFGGTTSFFKTLADGSPDESFNAAMNRVACPDRVFDLVRRSRGRAARMPDGRLVVAEAITLNPNPAVSGMRALSLPYRVCVSRFHADGSPDASFGTGGELLLAGGYFPHKESHIAEVLVRPNGGVALVVGQNFENPSLAVITVVWISADGGLDLAHLPTGLTGPMPGHVAVPTSAVMQPDGKLVIAGFAGLPQGAPPVNGSLADLTQPRVMRLHPQGGFDISFGPGQGYTTLAAGGRTLAPAHLHLAADGSIFVAGAVGSGDTSQFAVAKLVGGNAAPPPQQGGNATGGGGGGGCGITRDPRVDPMLPAMVLMAMAALAARRRRQ